MTDIVTTSTVSEYGFKRFVEVLTSSNTKIHYLGAFDDGESVLEYAESDNADFGNIRAEGYEVIYNWEAFQIVMSGDFETEGELDFSECETATDCVLLEARASVNGLFEGGWQEAREVTVQSLQALIDYMDKRYPAVDAYSFIATRCVPFEALGAEQVNIVVDEALGELIEYNIDGRVCLEYTPDNIDAATISVKFNPKDFGE